MKVVWLNFNKRIPTGPGVYWDTALLEELLKDCEFSTDLNGLNEAIVIIPGARAGLNINRINVEINKLKKCKLIITSDEDNKFPIDKIKHPKIEIFANYYNRKYKSEITWLPIGPARIVNLPQVEKDLDWFFAGQVTHKSRELLAKRLKKIPNGKLVATEGFAQGLDRDEYHKYMARAKAVPAPKGNVSPDSFRFYEALELGAVPIPEAPTYWPNLFTMPMVALKNWKEIQKEIDYISANLSYRNRCVAWWHRVKMDIKERLIGPGSTTVIIPVSPIKSHPSTEVIDKTIESIDFKAKIIVTFDGIREEQEHLRDNYEQFISNFLWKYNNKNVYPMIFDEHTHQVGMAREALRHVKTPTITYVEGDTGFTGVIEWDYCWNKIQDGTSNMIRFHYQGHIDTEHKYLMLDSDGDLLETAQYSQRPHIASTAYYRRILDSYFTPEALTFIEDKMHGVVANDYLEYGRQGWLQHRIHIYNPEWGLHHSFHTDGRDGEAKYDKDLVF